MDRREFLYCAGTAVACGLTGGQSSSSRTFFHANDVDDGYCVEVDGLLVDMVCWADIRAGIVALYGINEWLPPPNLYR